VGHRPTSDHIEFLWMGRVALSFEYAPNYDSWVVRLRYIEGFMLEGH